MKLKTLYLAVIACCLFTELSAQTDTSKFDLGNFSSSKDFIQNITIKGEDLEKMPFSSLDEAINVYFNGAYTNKESLIYVIDGNLLSNIDGYSIYDIESITLVQDARALLNGLSRHKQLVLITTRTGYTRNSGITASASSYLVKRRKEGEQSYYDQNSPTMFHQLNVSGRYFLKQTEIGASVNYLREAFPVETSDKTVSYKPYRLNRFNINTWLITQLGRSSTLNIRVNASPQDSGSRHHYMPLQNRENIDQLKGRQWQLYPSASLTTRISKQWYNRVDMNYLLLTSKTDNQQLANYTNPVYSRATTINIDYRQSLMLAREELGYTIHAGKWKINPALNLSYRHGKIKTNTYEISIGQSPGDISQSQSWQNVKYRQLTATTSMNISHSNIFDLQAGVQYPGIREKYSQREKNKYYPFASVAVDVIKLVSAESNTSLKLNASHAISESMLTPVYSTFPMNLPSRLQQVTTMGITLGLLKNRMMFTYTHEKNNYYTNIFVSIPSQSGFTFIYIEPQVKLETHRFGINYSTDPGKDFQYKTSLGIYGMKSVMEFDPSSGSNFQAGRFSSEYPQNGWSGGSTHHISYKNIFAGISGLYFLDEHKWTNQPNAQIVLQKANSFVLQEVYAGFSIKNLELYASSRNLFQNSNSTLPSGYKAYYGLGCKTSF